MTESGNRDFRTNTRGVRPANMYIHRSAVFFKIYFLKSTTSIAMYLRDIYLLKSIKTEKHRAFIFRIINTLTNILLLLTSK